MKTAIVILALVGALLAGLTVGLALDVQPVPDKFIFWGGSSVGDSALKVTEYELEREGVEITAVTVTVANDTDVTAIHVRVDVDITSYSVLHPSETGEIAEIPAGEEGDIKVELIEPALLLGLTNVQFFIAHD